MIIEHLLSKEKEMIISVHVIILLQTSVVFHCFLHGIFWITYIYERFPENDQITVRGQNYCLSFAWWQLVILIFIIFPSFSPEKQTIYLQP